MFDIDFEDFCSPEAREFFNENQNVAISKLLFKHAKDPLKKAWSLQLESRRRAEKKLPTWYKQAGVIFPPKLNLEQASSEYTALYKAQILSFNSSADLTAGTGIDSWQFALAGQKHTFVEPDTDLLALANHNFNVLSVVANFYCGTAEDFLDKNTAVFDLIYIDPSRRSESGSKVVLLEDYSPNVVAMQKQLLKIGTNVLIKVSPFADISYLISCFKTNVKEIHVVAVNNECKEILLLLSGTPHNSPQLKTINFTSYGQEKFDFFLEDELNKASLATEVENYIYEPNVAVLKSGAFNTVATKFNLKKLDSSSHLYTSDDVKRDFPGKVYAVVELSAPFKLKGNYQNVSIATRNFPDKAEKIRKRLKMKEGNAFKLFATTIRGKKMFVMSKFVANN